jgi:hypothetical protein
MWRQHNNRNSPHITLNSGVSLRTVIGVAGSSSSNRVSTVFCTLIWSYGSTPFSKSPPNNVWNEFHLPIHGYVFRCFWPILLWDDSQIVVWPMTLRRLTENPARARRLPWLEYSGKMTGNMWSPLADALNRLSRRVLRVFRLHPLCENRTYAAGINTYVAKREFAYTERRC